jgi:hypothetical protein
VAELSQIEQLAERRRELRAESERLRQQLAGELAKVRAVVVHVEQGYALVKALRPAWPLVASAAGFLVARKGGGLLESLRRVWSWWRLGQRVLEFWRSRGPGT